MKYWITLAFIIYLIPANAQNTYWAVTNEIDSFVLIRPNVQNSIMQRKKVISDRKENTQFIFDSETNSQTYIQPYCKNCDDKIELTLISFTNKIKPIKIILKSGEKISISDCFAKGHISTPNNNPLEWLRNILRLDRKERKEPRRSTGLKARKGAFPYDYKLDFIQANYSYYIDTIDLSISFKVQEGHSIKSIYIVNQERVLLFGAGDTDQLLEKRSNVLDTNFPSINSVITLTSKEENIEFYQFEWNIFQSYLLRELEPNEWYKVVIQIENDDTEYNPYIFNFQIISPIELNHLKSLFLNKNQK